MSRISRQNIGQPSGCKSLQAWAADTLASVICIAAALAGCGADPVTPAVGDDQDAGVADAIGVDGSQSDVVSLPDVVADTLPAADAVADLSAPEIVDAVDVQIAVDGNDKEVASDTAAIGGTCTVNADCPVSSKPCAVSKCSLASKTCVEFWQEPATACDDGDPCTEKTTCQCSDSSCGDIQCKGGIDSCGCKNNADCSKLDDGDLCNGTWFCDASGDPTVCKPNPATVVKCPPLFDDPCNVAICNPLTGLNAAGLCDVTPTADGTACDDGKLCTVGDKCVGGKCTEGVGTCECQQNSDCKDDGNLCNGLQYCDKAQFPFKCKINPGSIVTCSKGDDSVCGTNTCDPKTGDCALLAMPDGGKCDDNNYCTVGDHCDKGKCAAGENTCGCLKDGDCSKFEAKNKCLGKVFCNLQLFWGAPGGLYGAAALTDGGVALAGKISDALGTADGVLVFDEKGVVQQQVAGLEVYNVGFAGIVALPTGGAVEFGSIPGAGPLTRRHDANWNEVWNNPVHTGLAFNEYNGAAITASGTAIFVGRSLVDGIGGEKIGKGVLIREHLSHSQTLTEPVCTADAPCQSGGCDVTYGCVSAPTAAPCTDYNYCSSGDTCNQGVCDETKLTDCDDGNPCTEDVCATGGGCYGKPAKVGEICAADKTCDAGANCGKCPYVRKAIGNDKDHSYMALASLDVGLGNFVVVGRSNLAGVDDGYAAKFDTDGKPLWELKLDAAANANQLQTAALLADGGLLLGGLSYTGVEAFGYDGQMVRLDKDGKIVWKKIYNVVGNGSVHGLAVSGNSAYFAGDDAANWRWGEVDLATGKILWEQYGQTSSGDVWNDIVKLADGGWILAGSIGSGSSAVVQRLDANKKLKWTYQHKLAGSSEFRRTMVGGDGSLTAIGIAQSGSNGPLAVRLNLADGKILWQFSPAVGLLQNVVGGALIGDGSVLLTGHVDAYFGSAIGYVMRVDNNGKFLWLRLTTLSGGISALCGVTPDPGGTWTAQGWSDQDYLHQIMMHRFNLDGTFQCNP